MLVAEQTPGIVVWFEDTPAGLAALRHAKRMAERMQAHLTVVTVATRERVVGCGRCLSGTVLWNIEMKKIAHEELIEAQTLLGRQLDADYAVVVGSPVESIAEAAAVRHAETIVLPWHRERRLDPPERRHVGERVARSGPWDVIVGPEP